jgi:hypothetical protein
VEFFETLLSSPLAVGILSTIVLGLLAFGYFVYLPLLENYNKLLELDHDEKLSEQLEELKGLGPMIKDFIEEEFKQSSLEVLTSIRDIEKSLFILKEASVKVSELNLKFDCTKDKIDRMEAHMSKHPNMEPEIEVIKRVLDEVRQDCVELLRRYDSITGILLQHSTGHLAGQSVNLEHLK